MEEKQRALKMMREYEHIVATRQFEDCSLENIRYIADVMYEYDRIIAAHQRAANAG